MTGHEQSPDYGDHKRARRAEYLLTAAIAALVVAALACILRVTMWS
jgi:hypothetical protein